MTLGIDDLADTIIANADHTEIVEQLLSNASVVFAVGFGFLVVVVGIYLIPRILYKFF